MDFTLKTALAVFLSVTVLSLLLLASWTQDTAAAQTTDTPTPVPTAEQPDNFSAEDLAAALAAKKKAQKYPNMDSNLNNIVQQVETGQFTAQAAAASAPIHQEQSVAVTLYITEGYADALAAYLESNGASPRNIGADYIEAYIPVSLLPEASEREGVISIRTIIPPQPAQGVVVSEGVAAHGAPSWHAAGIKGRGVIIGVIDVGFEGFRALMGTELPASVEARCYTDIGAFSSSLSDCEVNEYVHGTAVTEAAFDIAPEAAYYISNPVSFGDLQTAVNWMIDNDVDVINYSLNGLWEGPGDGTTPFSNGALRTVDTAVENGTTFVNSAGNEARATWFGSTNRQPFNPRYPFRFQRWSGSDVTNCANLTSGEIFIAQLRWDDTWSGARRDLDLILFDSEIEIVSSSSDFQFGGALHIPFEFLRYTPSASGTYCLVVSHRNSNPSFPSWIQLQALSSETLERHTTHHSIGSPAESANPGLLAVGAAGRNGSVSNSFDTTIIEPFSSQGPTPDGRVKPDIVGVDAGQTVTLRSDTNPDGYFFGTSQSSPHVAGLAALVKQSNPAYTPAQIAQYLKNNAEARGAVPNNTWGYGFANLPASDAVAPTPVPTATPVSPTVPPEVLNRISALETLVETLRGLISTLEGSISALNDSVSALTGRVAALESGASIPTPVPTPTTVPGETPVPTPTQTPVADACLTGIASDGAVNGSWTSACTTDRNLITANARIGTRNAGYYTFALSQQSEVTMTLESSEDTYLFLLSGHGRDGEKVAENDDIDTPGRNYNSRIVETLAAGEYTILATTYDLASQPGGVGDFTLTVSGIR